MVVILLVSVSRKFMPIIIHSIVCCWCRVGGAAPSCDCRISILQIIKKKQ